MSTYVSITDFGARGDGRTDNRAAIQKALDHAKATGQAVYVPEGNFLHKGVLKIDGVDIYGAGGKSVLKAVGAASSDAQALIVSGDGASIKNLTLDSDATARGGTGNSAKVWVVGAKNFEIDHVTINNSFGAGILVGKESAFGKVTNNAVKNTNADSIHFYQGSHDILVKGNRVENSGDDGIAVVSYAKNAAWTQDITIENNTIVNNHWGRGISVVGGQDVVIRNNLVDGNKNGAAGVYIASEPAYDTWGVKNVTVENNTIKNVGGYSTGHGAVMIYSGTSRMVEDIIVRNNQILDAEKNGIFVRGDKIDDILLSKNLIAGSGAAPIAISGKATDVVQTGNVTDPAAWKPSGSSPVEPVPTPIPAPAPTPEAKTLAVTVYAAGDDYKGDPQFRLLLDGKAFGSAQTVTMDRGDGWQQFKFNLPAGTDPNRISVEYFNDLYGGKGMDRNLEIDRIVVGNQTFDPGKAGFLTGNGQVHFDVVKVDFLGLAGLATHTDL